MGKGLTELTSRKLRQPVFDKRDATTIDIWLTPKFILSALGDFDLDPCAASHRPWDTAKHHYTKEDDGLSQQWVGRVWMNPPYGRQPPIWLKRLYEHGDGIALIAARTSNIWFHKLVWEKADGILFFKGRLNFYKENGQPGDTMATFPSCLVAYGMKNALVLKTVAGGILEGHYIGLKNNVLEMPVLDKLSA
jgi:phage N-6-adenine-methyltransferase